MNRCSNSPGKLWTIAWPTFRRNTTNQRFLLVQYGWLCFLRATHFHHTQHQPLWTTSHITVSARQKRWREGLKTNGNLLQQTVARIRRDVEILHRNCHKRPEWLPTTCKSSVSSAITHNYTWECCTTLRRLENNLSRESIVLNVLYYRPSPRPHETLAAYGWWDHNEIELLDNVASSSMMLTCHWLTRLRWVETI